MIADDVGVAADFLEEYALRPPRAEPHQTSVDSPRWREIQTRLRDLAGRLRRSGSGAAKVSFVDSDAQFLETQSSRLFRMHHWIKRGPLTSDSHMMAEASKLAAERLQVIAAMVRSRKTS